MLTKEQEAKGSAIDILKRRVPEQLAQLAMIDDRLAEYFTGLCDHSGVEMGDENDQHNMYELLCGIRFLRLLRTYTVDTAEVKDAIYDGEGKWRKDSAGFWEHVCGGLRQPGRRAPEVYRWEPFQVFCLASMYGLKAWIPTGNHDGDHRLANSERVNREGEIEDLRRLCTRFILYGPRKINKSGYGAICNVRDFMKGDYDAQVVCTANSQEQAKILFNKTRDLLLQLDPVSGRKFNGEFLSYSATEVKFQKGAWRQATLQAIPAGGKMPDGKFASMCDGDEYGSAGYTNGRSDMGQTMAVIESSMGPRREPMTLITTTASLISAGPFMEMLESTHRLLLEELKYDTGEEEPTLAEDRQMCLLLEPDEWERDEEYLLTSKAIRRKVNPMLGKIVQHSFYEDEVAKSRMDEVKKKETISKLFNVYQSGKISEWVKAEEIRALQVDMRIDQCTAARGWVVFVGLDFSQGDDLHTAGYLAVRRGTHGGYEYFADFDAWIKEDVLERSTIRPLYDEWVKNGYLHISPGKVFQPSLFIKRLDELLDKGVQFQYFGYDAYQSKDPVNTLKSYLNEKLKVLHPENYVFPVSQLNGTYNPAVDQLTYCIKAAEPMIHFSRNSMWPWCFGNAVLDIDKNENKKPKKRNPGSESCKVDPTQTLCTGYILCAKFEGG